MSAINEAIVREYFESLGFLVSQPCKYIGPARHKKAEEEIDLIVFNPLVGEQKLPADIVWTTSDLRSIARAVVGISGWHTEHFTVARFEKTPELLNFVAEKAVRAAALRLGSGNLARILCLPQIPAAGETRNKMLKSLKEKGVDGILSFHTILLELVARLDTHKNYEKSDVLQVIRILKHYDFLKDSQMEFFNRKRSKKRPETPAPV